MIIKNISSKIISIGLVLLKPDTQVDVDAKIAELPAVKAFIKKGWLVTAPGEKELAKKKAKEEAAMRAKIEAEMKAKAEAEAKAKAEAEAKAKAEAEAEAKAKAATVTDETAQG